MDIEECMVVLQAGAGHPENRILTYWRIKCLCHLVRNAQHLSGFFDSELIGLNLRHPDLSAALVVCAKVRHKPTDIHYLVRARRSGCKLIHIVFSSEAAHIHFHEECIGRRSGHVDGETHRIAIRRIDGRDVTKESGAEEARNEMVNETDV